MSWRTTWYDIKGALGALGYRLGPATKWILIINCAVFVWVNIILRLASFKAFELFIWFSAERPELAISNLMVWQFVTYMFIHGSLIHILFNMLIFFFFAPRLEFRWHTREFLKFYFIVGIGAALFHAGVSYLFGRPDEAVVGASGAILGILLAYAFTWPNDIVLVMGIAPMKVKHAVILLIILDFVLFAQPLMGTRISFITHLGGLIVAFLYLKGPDIYRRLRYRRARYYRIDQGRRRFFDDYPRH